MNKTPKGRGRALTLILVIGLFALLASVLWHVVDAVQPGPVFVSIDGEEVINGLDLASMQTSEKLVFLGVAAVALLAALVVIPLALLFAMIGVLIAVLAAVGLPLFVVLAALTLLMSPFLLVIWLLWRALRPSPSIGA